MQEMKVRSMSQEDILKKEMATHSNILVSVPWIEEFGKPQSMGSQKSQTQPNN